MGRDALRFTIPLSALLVVGLGLLYFWNAESTLLSQTQTYSLDGAPKHEIGLRVARHRFRPITTFDFLPKSDGSGDKYTFGAFTIHRVDAIEWLKSRRAVLMTLEVEYDSEGIASTQTLLYDFDGNCFLSPMHGRVTREEFQRIVEAVRAGVKPAYSLDACLPSPARGR
jgi:hypothetical protein